MIENFTIFGKTFSAYMISALVGIFVMGFYAINRAKKKNIDDLEFTVMLLWSALGVLIGGHILYGITNIKYIVEVLGKGICWNTIKQVCALFSGSVFYGGLLGGVFVGYIYIRKKGLPVSDSADIMAAGIPLFHFFGRIGCFLSGCCYGIAIPNGITYHHSIVEIANGVPRLPIQLIEAGGNLGLFFLFHYMGKREKGKGKLLHLYFILYGCMRFANEFLRGDEYRGFLMGFSTSQWISVLLMGFAFTKMFVERNKRKNSETV